MLNHIAVRRVSLALLPLALASTLACETAKSANPLSPDVAGPIPGVSITPPKLLEPVNGLQLANDKQPIELLFENPTTSGDRPLYLEVEVATDAAFANKVHTSARLTPGTNGRTTYKLPEALQAGRSYYWRGRAADGANTGPWAGASSFEVLIPKRIDTPVPLAPIRREVTANNTPELVVQNGVASGVSSPVLYRFELTLDLNFTTVSAVLTVPRSSDLNTRVTLPALPLATTFYWRVSASDGALTSAYSAIQAFVTPTPPPPPVVTPPVVTPPVTNPPVTNPPPTGNRTPDPPSGQRLPLPNMAHIVEEVARDYPSALRNSCQDRGGTWEFMDRLVDRLRQYDTRWGYNGKRGNTGDPSQDVVDYHYGRGADEGSTEVYIIDIMGGHCGSNPTPAWIDQTQVTANAGTIGRWTGRGRF
jgi:hypothetical protein